MQVELSINRKHLLCTCSAIFCHQLSISIRQQVYKTGIKDQTTNATESISRLSYVLMLKTMLGSCLVQRQTIFLSFYSVPLECPTVKCVEVNEMRIAWINGVNYESFVIVSLYPYLCICNCNCPFCICLTFAWALKLMEMQPCALLNLKW